MILKRERNNRILWRTGRIDAEFRTWLVENSATKCAVTILERNPAEPEINKFLFRETVL